jgi:exoribonuclease-2
MERYWCLRWLQQNGISEIGATVRREQLVKLDHLPLLLRVPSLPADIGPGRRVRLAVESIDLLGPELSCRYLSVMEEVLPEMVEEEEAQ